MERLTQQWYKAQERIKKYQGKDLPKAYNLMELREKATEVHNLNKEFADYLASYAPILFEDSDLSVKFDETLKLLADVCIKCDLLINAKTD